MKKRRSLRNRNGAAVAELAVCLPILVMLVFGSIEATNSIHLKQAATAAAYEGARVATSSGGTQQATLARIGEVLAAHSLTGTTITVSPTVDANLARGTSVTVAVSVPSDQNKISVTSLFNSQSLSASVSMIRQ